LQTCSVIGKPLGQATRSKGQAFDHLLHNAQSPLISIAEGLI
jgi:hypothetical protein